MVAISIGDSVEGVAVDGAGSPGSPVNATFGPDQSLFSYASSGLNGDIGTATAVETGADGVVGWGRWVNGTVSTDIYTGLPLPVPLSGSESHHYAVGVPTADMPTGGTASYSLLGATSPTLRDGTGTGTVTAASLNVDFGSGLVDATVAFTLGGDGYSISSAAGGEPLSISGSRFGGSLSSSSVGGTGGACVSGCSASIEGFFAGSGASRAGLAYDVADFFNSKQINGAAAFTRSGAGTPIGLPAL